MAVTMREVAAAAGVSMATASRALSGSRKVSPHTEHAVHAASVRLGYRVNRVAQSLRTQSTGTVGMVVPRISNPYFPHLVEVVERRLSAGGRELLLCDSQNDTAIEGTRVNALLDRRVDGLLFVACDSRASGATLARAREQLPVVQMDRYIEGADVDFVGVDNTAGMLAVIAHLVATGCRTFGLAGAQTLDSSAGQRLRGYRDAAKPVDRPSAERILLGDYSVAWGVEAAERLLAQGPLPDAIVCGADIIALGVVAALRGAGISVPADISVTGFDDIAFAGISAPPLTTVRQPTEEIGAESVRLLEDRLAGAWSASQQRTLRPALVVRGSTRQLAPAR